MEQKQALLLSKTFLDTKSGDISQKDIFLFQELMKYHSELYYEQEAPLISDREYDTLFVKLREAEEHL